MTRLTINDLNQSTEMSHEAMTGIRGGLTANIDNSQQANQLVTGAYGPVFAINSPVSAPSTILTENNPFTLVDLDTIGLTGSHQNAIAA